MHLLRSGDILRHFHQSKSLFQSSFQETPDSPIIIDNQQ